MLMSYNNNWITQKKRLKTAKTERQDKNKNKKEIKE